MNRKADSPLPDNACAGSFVTSATRSASLASSASSFIERFSPPVHHAERTSLQQNRSMMVRYPSIRDVQKASIDLDTEPWAQVDLGKRELGSRSAPHKHQPRFEKNWKREPGYQPQNRHVSENIWQHEAELQRSFAYDFLSSRSSSSMTLDHANSPRDHHGYNDIVNVSRRGFGYERTSQERYFTDDYSASSVQQTPNRHMKSEPPRSTYNEHCSYRNKECHPAGLERTVQSHRKKPPPTSLPPPLLKKTDTTVIEIEISPGYYTPLRGAEETMRAFNRGDMVEALCFACQDRLQCISNCSYVLCPECRVVSPVEEDSVLCSIMERYGIGLGLKL